MENIKNLPVIPHKDIVDKSENYRVWFYVTEYQAEEIFGRYQVYLRYRVQSVVNSFDEVFGHMKPQRPDGLEIEGTSKLVRVLSIEASPNMLYIEGVSYWVLFNGQLLRPYRNKLREPFRFFLVGATQYDSSKLKYFKFEESEPQRVSKATPKKLQAWADYLNAEEAAKQAYIKANKDKKEAFFKRLDASGVKYRINGSEVTIYNGCLMAKVSISEGSIYCRAPEFNGQDKETNPYYNIYKETALDFILNNTFPVIPKNDNQRENQGD